MSYMDKGGEPVWTALLCDMGVLLRQSARGQRHICPPDRGIMSVVGVVWCAAFTIVANALRNRVSCKCDGSVRLWRRLGKALQSFAAVRTLRLLCGPQHAERAVSSGEPERGRDPTRRAHDGDAAARGTAARPRCTLRRRDDVHRLRRGSVGQCHEGGAQQGVL